MESIYSGYRGSHYFNIRNSYEPSYTTELNNALGHDQEVLSIRHEFVRSAITDAAGFPISRLTTAIDVGGDQGQFMPPEIPLRFVLDVSDKEPAPGVQRIGSFHQATQLKPDLLMACGILEHVADPISFMRELVAVDAEMTGLFIYVEVPSGVPQRRPTSHRILGAITGLVASRSTYMWSRLDRFSAFVRRRGKSATHLMPMRQSEHINFFSTMGLGEVATTAGAQVVLLDEVSVPSTLHKNGRIQFSGTIRMLARTGTK